MYSWALLASQMRNIHNKITAWRDKTKIPEVLQLNRFSFGLMPNVLKLFCTSWRTCIAIKCNSNNLQFWYIWLRPAMTNAVDCVYPKKNSPIDACSYFQFNQRTFYILQICWPIDYCLCVTRTKINFTQRRSMPGVRWAQSALEFPEPALDFWEHDPAF